MSDHSQEHPIDSVKTYALVLGSLLVPGVGPIVVGGVLASTLTGAGIGAATGGIIGALMGLGVPEPDARHFDQGLRLGSTLVTVDAGPRTREALMILDRHGMDFGPSGTERFGAFDRAGGTAGDPTMAAVDLGSRIGMGDVASGSSTGTRGLESRRVARERSLGIARITFSACSSRKSAIGTSRTKG